MKIAYSKLSHFVGTTKVPFQQVLTAARIVFDELAYTWAEVFTSAII